MAAAQLIRVRDVLSFASSTSLIGVRPRSSALHVSQGRTVLVTGLDGFVGDAPEHGLFVHETRLVSRFRHLIDGTAPLHVAVSNVEQHSSLGYYITWASRHADEREARPSAEMAQQALELRLSRFVGGGMHARYTSSGSRARGRSPRRSPSA